MIIGSGLIAKAFSSYFSDKSDLTIFASGVSNSLETSETAFEREAQLLAHEIEKQKWILYFSSCAIYDPTLANTPYVLHKRKMEQLLLLTDNYTILRLPQVVGKTNNPSTLTNFLYNHIAMEKPFTIWKQAKRYLIDVDDILLITRQLYETAKLFKMITNISSPFSIPIVNLVNIFEGILQQKANYTLIDKGGAYTIETDLSVEIAKEVGIDFENNYVEKLIAKYYGG